MSSSSAPGSSRPYSTLKVVDLFCGLGGWSAAFKERGHDVVTLDNNKRFNATIRKNILDVTVDDFPFRPDIVLASPPCEGFTRLRYAFNWDSEDRRKPISVKAKLGIKMLEKALALISELKPRYFIIENPVGRMRYMDCIALLERRTVTYCQYGSKAQKPTDLWGMFPESLRLRPRCHENDPCHQSSRGRLKGAVVSMHSAAERAVVPYELSMAVCLAAEQDLLCEHKTSN